MNRSAARQLISSLPAHDVLIVGDLMLDDFLFGDVERISPEAPVPVVRFRREEFRLGGAANVAHNVHALGALPRLVGVVGADDAADRLGAELAKLGVSGDSLVVARDRSTTRKVRVVTRRNQQVSRIDYEADDPLNPEVEEDVIRRVDERLPGVAVVVISDYLKGAVSKRIASHVIGRCRSLNVPVIVDPKVPHVDFYAGATVITPNHHEAEAVTLTRIRSSEEARAAAHAFRERARCASVLITRGEHGMWLLDGEEDHELPATALEVSDVTGAGDTVVATLASALAAGASLLDAAWLANRAAGIAVAKFGAAVVTPEELTQAL